MPKEIVGLVKKHVAEPCTDESTEKQVHEQSRQIFERPSFSSVRSSDNPITEEETKRKEKPIPPESQWTEVNDVWSHVPHQVMHIKCQHITLERSLKQESPRNTPPIEIYSIVGPDAG